MNISDPATLQPIARVPDLGETEARQAVDAAVPAAVELKKTTGKRRGQLLREWYNLVRGAQNDLASIITAENGKTIAEALGEVTYAADFIDWFAGAAPRTDGSVGPILK